MWLGFLLSLTYGGPPENVDLGLIDKWKDGAEAMLEGTSGCWELVGHARWNWQAGRVGEVRGEAVFAGRLEAGIWRDFYIHPLGEISRRRSHSERLEYSDERHFAPLVGKLAADVSESGSRRGPNPADDPGLRNVMRRTLEAVGSMVNTSWASWDEERQGVVYHTSVPLGGGRRAPEASIQVFFPGGGHWATEQDVVFPRQFRLDRSFAPIVEDARVQLRATVRDGKVFPTAESLSFGVRRLGFRLTGAQTIEYTHASPCSGW
jgi:hypothetical protein